MGLDAQIVVGNSGEFTVWVDGAKVAEKVAGKFPEPAAIVAAVQRATG